MKLNNLTTEEKLARKRKQKAEAQRRYYQKNKEYYKNYNKENSYTKKLQQENQQLQNNWNELKKWLKDTARWDLELEDCFNTREVLIKMQSLERGEE